MVRGITAGGEPQRFFKFAFRAALPQDRKQRVKAFEYCNRTLAGLGHWADHAERVGVRGAVADYICGLVECGVTPYRERYQARFMPRRGLA